MKPNALMPIIILILGLGFNLYIEGYKLRREQKRVLTLVKGTNHCASIVFSAFSISISFLSIGNITLAAY
jgi:hypothetical protein